MNTTASGASPAAHVDVDPFAFCNGGGCADQFGDADYALSPEQERIVQLAHTQNLFITGPGGVGKSVVTRRIIQDLCVTRDTMRDA